MKQHTIIGLSLWLASVALSLSIEWRDGDRVVLLGNTFVERAQSYGHLETVLAAGLAERKVTFRNLGWSGDTVYGDARSYFGPPKEGFDRLNKHLEEIKPTIVISAYGAVAAFGGPSGLDSFLTGYARLLDMVVKTTGARVVVMSPPPLENHPAPLPNQDTQNINLAAYRDGIQKLANRRGHDFADLFEALGAGRLANRKPALTENGLHYTEQGYAVMAPILAGLLGVPPTPMRVSSDTPEFQVSPASLADTQLEVRVSGLKPGDYTLKATDGRTLRTASEQMWSQGIVIRQRLWAVEYDQLRRAIVEKNQAFFHRWRPQNETYLFGFRKHEQGNNAVEVPQFDPIVAAADASIHILAAPQTISLFLTKHSK